MTHMISIFLSQLCTPSLNNNVQEEKLKIFVHRDVGKFDFIKGNYFTLILRGETAEDKVLDIIRRLEEEGYKLSNFNYTSITKNSGVLEVQIFHHVWTLIIKDS